MDTMKISLVYMARPIYGGWVTFTSHLCLKYNCELYKVGKRTEKNERKFGYGVSYRNLSIDELIQKENLYITAIDKHYYEYVDKLPNGTTIVIHDPTELKGKDNILVQHLHRFNVIVIRETMKQHLIDYFQKESQFLLHPFYEYSKMDNSHSYYSLSISRIDFDKHTDLILKANQFIKDDTKKIQIFGAENRLYVHHKLKGLNFESFWKGKYPKTLPMTYQDKDLLNQCKFVIDMSIIKGDGGGTQYTFLEAIYHDCALILHEEWVSKGDLFIDKYNCYVVGGDTIAEQIATIIETPLDETYYEIIKNSKEIIKKHTEIKWF